MKQLCHVKVLNDNLSGYLLTCISCVHYFFFQAEDGIRDWSVTGVQTCALPISHPPLELVELARELLFLRQHALLDLLDAALALAHLCLDLRARAQRHFLRFEVGGQIGRASCRERV